MLCLRKYSFINPRNATEVTYKVWRIKAQVLKHNYQRPLINAPMPAPVAQGSAGSCKNFFWCISKYKLMPHSRIPILRLPATLDLILTWKSNIRLLIRGKFTQKCGYCITKDIGEKLTRYCFKKLYLSIVHDLMILIRQLIDKAYMTVMCIPWSRPSPAHTNKLPHILRGTQTVWYVVES